MQIRPHLRRCTPTSTRSDPCAGRSSLFAVLLVLWAVTLCTALGLRQRAAQAGFGWIDPATLTLGELGPGCDPRWSALFEATTGTFPLLRSDDEPGIDELLRAIDELSFVREVGAAEVLWPDGLAIELVLRVPVACIPVGDRFQSVAEDGTLLPGLWPAPPRVASHALPVLGPLSDGEELFLHARPGDFLAEPEHLAALDVALSIDEHLGAADRDLLGPVVIDATREAVCSVDEPGVRIELACGRTVLFGRAPSTDEPGELAAERKWIGVAHALALLDEDDPADDWDRLDVRWDHPELSLTNAPLLADAVPGSPVRRFGDVDAPSSAGLLAPGRSGLRVR